MYRGEFLVVDSGFLEMFTYPAVAGNVSEALKDPSSIVITERVAQCRQLKHKKDCYN
ncbi:hypothetical protein [Chondrinema litorale]|uniref:hypothetical protein n=1 Tax=Chondrinema litorale TaxID=2994555 RepID=UPI00254355A0|nr:hypothetical protein [Chondrinema litorale]UZR94075.1 hypothetical protein OQ292_19725 [Chondrinema litorale]